MLIISTILEIDDDKFFNTSVVINSLGEIVGKYRKSHVPPIEASFLSSGDFNCPLFETEFGRIGILICYERHFPLCWLMLNRLGAEIVFNPSSEERLWLVEGRNAAFANGFFTVSTNRVGNEKFSNALNFNYFGSSYIACPLGFMTKTLPKSQDGILLADIDLNICRRVKENLSFHKNQHLEVYFKKLNHLMSK
ncbi:CLUMA_CG007585, isoform A [Clunio marinus]|uniref:CLUMA_CG007585, isoform A n=1 Tax=Clunio marinus TaxID=568069 RepID=A0A1J1I573_9DIPT|nr:CLUMA_CG007585, isoform A [Clunio marinus]